jgi:hypothetical protein
MKTNKRNPSIIFLILGLAFLTIGMAADNTAFSVIAIVFVLIALLANARRPKSDKNKQL